MEASFFIGGIWFLVECGPINSLGKGRDYSN